MSLKAMKTTLPKDPKELLDTIKFNYKQIEDKLQKKLKSGKLTEEQKIKIYFYIKKEEAKNMRAKDLTRSKKKYEQTIKAIDSTIAFIEEKKEKKVYALFDKQLQKRLRLEKTTKKQCEALLKTIEKEEQKRLKK